MLRFSLYFICGIFFAALLIGAISVYALHDVDRDRIGEWNAAFKYLCVESALFAMIIGAATGLLTSIGRRYFHARDDLPRPMLSLGLGIAVAILQYPWDIAARKLSPNYAQWGLWLYLIVAVLTCTAVLIRGGLTPKSRRVAEIDS